MNYEYSKQQFKYLIKNSTIFPEINYYKICLIKCCKFFLYIVASKLKSYYE